MGKLLSYSGTTTKIRAIKSRLLTRKDYETLAMAGLKECGLCCEIMREDGTMMRTA